MWNDSLPAIVLIGVVSTGILNAGSPIADTRQAVSKWVETRQLSSREKADWLGDKESLEASIELHSIELERLDRATAETQTNSTGIDAEFRKQEGESAAFKATADELDARLSKLEAELTAFTPLLPLPLAEKLDPALRRLASVRAGGRSSLSERMQTVVALLNETEKFNGSLSLSGEIRKDAGGAERAVTVLYLGLGQAFFVDKPGTFAGVGVPHSTGWKWEEQTGLAAAIRAAVDIYESSQPAAFVALPIQVINLESRE